MTFETPYLPLGFPCTLIRGRVRTLNVMDHSFEVAGNSAREYILPPGI